jgi:hypothetical protein
MFNWTAAGLWNGHDLAPKLAGIGNLGML